MLGVISLPQFDAQLLKLGAHGRIHILVTAAYPVPQLPGDDRKRPHESSTNAKDMNVHNSKKQDAG